MKSVVGTPSMISALSKAKAKGRSLGVRTITMPHLTGDGVGLYHADGADCLHTNLPIGGIFASFGDTGNSASMYDDGIVNVHQQSCRQFKSRVRGTDPLVMRKCGRRASYTVATKHECRQLCKLWLLVIDSSVLNPYIENIHDRGKICLVNV